MGDQGDRVNDILIGNHEHTAVELDPHSGNRQRMIETVARQTVRTIGSQPGRRVPRSVLGGIFGGRR